MVSNPYLAADLAGKRSSKGTWSAVGQRLTEDLYEIALMRNFFQVWINQGYPQAVDSLPDDNPGTPVNEAISEADMQKRAEEFFGKPWSQINNSDVAQLQNSVGELMAKIRNLLARKSLVNGIVYDLDTEIKQIQLLQQSGKALA
jgi:hypothetical protein